MKKQRSASPSQAMPRSAPVERTRSMISRRLLLQQWVGFVVGELAVGLEVHLLEVEPSLSQDRPDHRPRHPVAAVDDHASSASTASRVDEGERVGAVLLPDVDLLE